MKSKLEKNQLIGVFLFNIGALCTALMYSDINRTFIYITLFILVHLFTLYLLVAKIICRNYINSRVSHEMQFQIF